MPRPALSEQELLDTRERLSTAALSLYVEEGDDAVTFRRLAQRLGASHTLPFRYFSGRDELMAQMRIHCFERFMEAIQAGDPGSGDAVDRLYAIATAILAWVKANPEGYRLMFSLRQPPLARFPALLAVRRAAFDYLVEITRLAVAAGNLAGNPRTIMHIAWASVHGVLSLHAANQLVHGCSLDDLIEPLLLQLLEPLRGSGRHAA